VPDDEVADGREFPLTRGADDPCWYDIRPVEVLWSDLFNDPAAPVTPWASDPRAVGVDSDERYRRPEFYF